MLTPKRERFCEEYLVDLNGTQAAIRAGYSAHTANRTASMLLSKADVQAKLAVLRARVSEKTAITTEWVADRLRHEATLTGPDATHSGRVSALNTLARTLGMLTDRLRVEGEVKVVTPPPLNLAGMNAEELSQFRQLVARALPAPGNNTGATAPGD